MGVYQPAAIANEFRDISGLPLDQKKLQKLTYITHGWNLAILGHPLVIEQAQAWDNGPVFRSIWNNIRDYGRDVNGYIIGMSKTPLRANFNEFENKLLNFVWQRYGSLNSSQLSDMTHQQNTPWTQTYFNQGRDAYIDNTLIKEHFLELANAAKEPA